MSQVSLWCKTHMESQSPTRTRWVDVLVCMRVLSRKCRQTVRWMKVTSFHCSNCFKLPWFLFKSDFRSVHHPSWCSHIIYSPPREDNHKNVYFLCQQFIKMCENVYKRILLDSSLILFGSPYWLSLVINRFQLSPCFRDGNVSSIASTFIR